jgi:CRISPR/Cas system CMR-associated protein Cmr5 small subunit
MWQKLKEQLPTIILTAALILGVAFWFSQKTAAEAAAKQQAEMAALREQTNAEMKANAEETRRHIESVNQLLKDAISKRAADVFMTDEEVAKLNDQKVNQLAEAIAAKVMPYGTNIPKTPEEAEKVQNEQVDKVSGRMVEKISPILSEMAKDQNLTRESINGYSQRISDQISGVLTAEMSRNQELNTQLLSSQAVAQDSMKLSHELTALYLSSFRDQGLITRLLTLPANVVRDAANLSIVNSSDRKKVEERLVTQMNELDKRLAEVQAAAPKK